jgi:hypothetical protein
MDAIDVHIDISISLRQFLVRNHMRDIRTMRENVASIMRSSFAEDVHPVVMKVPIDLLEMLQQCKFLGEWILHEPPATCQRVFSAVCRALTFDRLPSTPNAQRFHTRFVIQRMPFVTTTYYERIQAFVTSVSSGMAMGWIYVLSCPQCHEWIYHQRRERPQLEDWTRSSIPSSTRCPRCGREMKEIEEMRKIRMVCRISMIPVKRMDTEIEGFVDEDVIPLDQSERSKIVGLHADIILQKNIIIEKNTHAKCTLI